MGDTFNIRTDLISPSVASSIVPAFHMAYSMACEVVESNSFLAGPLRDQTLPIIKNAAVEFVLYRRAEQGLIPFDVKWVTNSRKNHTHLELRRNGYVLTVSQTHSWDDIPRRCVFRNDRNIDGQLALAGFKSDVSTSKEIYAILTHGWKQSVPTFLYCGVPNANMTAWVDGIDLQNEYSGIRRMEAPKVSQEIVLEFKSHMKEKENLTSE